MNTPKGLTKEQTKLWGQLFIGFRPTSEIENEMAKRYLIWLELYEKSKTIVEAEGTVIVGGNNIPYPNPHFSNMLKAEGEMRRLWKQLEKRMTEPKDDTEDLGEFKGL